MGCAPSDAFKQVLLSDEQKAEMKRGGFDIDEFARLTGRPTEEIVKRSALFFKELQRLQHAANPPPDPESSPDQKGYL